MFFTEALFTYDTIVESGPLGTRLKYDYMLDAPPHIAVTQSAGKTALNEIYRGDIAVAQENRIPIIINAPTFRASRNHLRIHGLDQPSDVRKINMECISFVKAIRDSYEDLSAPIFIGAPIGSLTDAYSVDGLLISEIAKQYHQEQVDIFEEAGVDLIYAVTISSLVEALGIAFAVQQSNVEYTIGFILNEQGTLLDGAPLHEAIRALDEGVDKKPLGYLITCTHASTISKLNSDQPEYKRLIGIQTNGSDLSLITLAAKTTPVTDAPDKFAADLVQLKSKFELKIMAGCCGTSRDHLQAIAKAFKF